MRLPCLHDQLCQRVQWQGRICSSSALDEEVLSCKRRVGGEKHPDTLHSINNSQDFACRYLLLRDVRVDANCDACAIIMGPSNLCAILSVFVRALCSFYARKKDAQGLAAALQAGRDSLNCPEIDNVEREYDAAVALRGA